MCPSNANATYRTRGDKLKDAVNYLKEKFMEYYVPAHYLSVNESTVSWVMLYLKFTNQNLMSGA